MCVCVCVGRERESEKVEPSPRNNSNLPFLLKAHRHRHTWALIYAIITYGIITSGPYQTLWVQPWGADMGGQSVHVQSDPLKFALPLTQTTLPNTAESSQGMTWKNNICTLYPSIPFLSKYVLSGEKCSLGEAWLVNVKYLSFLQRLSIKFCLDVFWLGLCWGFFQSRRSGCWAGGTCKLGQSYSVWDQRSRCVYSSHFTCTYCIHSHTISKICAIYPQ